MISSGLILYFMILFYIIINPRRLKISIDSSSLNIFSYSVLHLLQIEERTNVFPKRYDILGFLNFL